MRPCCPAPAGPGSGTGPARRILAASPTSCSAARAMSRRWRRSPRPGCWARGCRNYGCGWSTSSTSCACRTSGSTPHGLSHPNFDALFSVDRPVIFAFHGYPSLVHQLTYRRTNHANIHVRGFREEGTTTTPFDMLMMNDLDRYRLICDVIDRVPGLAERAAGLRQQMLDQREVARAYTREHGEDLPEVARWVFNEENNTQGSA